MKTVPLPLLKEKLNALYWRAKQLNQTACHSERFNLIWDLKEKALVEGKAAVEIPGDWLQELDLAEGDQIAQGRHS